MVRDGEMLRVASPGICRPPTPSPPTGRTGIISTQGAFNYVLVVLVKHTFSATQPASTGLQLCHALATSVTCPID